MNLEKTINLCDYIKFQLDTLNYKIPKTLVCESQSTNFEKNWGPFTYKNKLHMLYDINPLKILEVDGQYNCKMVINKSDKKISDMVKSFGDLHFHMRNSSNLIKFGKEYSIPDFLNKPTPWSILIIQKSNPCALLSSIANFQQSPVHSDCILGT